MPWSYYAKCANPCSECRVVVVLTMASIVWKHCDDGFLLMSNRFCWQGREVITTWTLDYLVHLLRGPDPIRVNSRSCCQNSKCVLFYFLNYYSFQVIGWVCAFLCVKVGEVAPYFLLLRVGIIHSAAVFPMLGELIFCRLEPREQWQDNREAICRFLLSRNHEFLWSPWVWLCGLGWIRFSSSSALKT